MTKYKITAQTPKGTERIVIESDKNPLFELLRNNDRYELAKAVLTASRPTLGALLELYEPDVARPSSDKGWAFLRDDVIRWALQGRFDELAWREVVDD